jgi:hypothetical protein
MTRDEKIQDIAIRFIGPLNTTRTDWKFTIIGKLHPQILGEIDLEPGELVIVSGFFSSESWYVFTTRRIVSQFEGGLQILDPTNGVDADFGNFKGYGSEPFSVATIPREVMTLKAKGTVASLRLEFPTWEESTLPIWAARYWNIKHPFLDKLMTTPELEEFKKRRRENEKAK